MRMAPIATSQSGRVITPPKFWLKEMRNPSNMGALTQITLDPGFYHSYIVGAHDERHALREAGKFRNMMRGFPEFRDLGWIARGELASRPDYVHGYPCAMEIIYAMLGPLPPRAVNGAWMSNIAIYKYQDSTDIFDPSSPQLG